MIELDALSIAMTLIITIVWGWIRYWQTRDTVAYYVSLYCKNNQILSEKARDALKYHSEYERAYKILDGKHSYKVYYIFVFTLTVVIPILLGLILGFSIDVAILKFFTWIILAVDWWVFLTNMSNSDKNIYLSTFKRDLDKISQYARSLEYRDA